jgi:rubrerythrin
MAHHAEVLDNIRRQREVGIDSWLREQGERWRCPACGCGTNWYAGKCPKCGGALEGHF